MSHFTVMVIGENPENQLAPFDENLDTPKYIKYTKDQLIEKGRKEIEDYKNGIYAEYLADPEKYADGCRNQNRLNYIKNEFPKKLMWSDDQIYQNEINGYEDDMTPEGGIYSTYNPKSKWDWYQLGGRWPGVLKVKEGVEFSEPNFSWGWDYDIKAKNQILSKARTDSALKKDIENLNEIKTFAVVKDGHWYERGEWGWWGFVSNEKDQAEWEAQINKLIERLPDDTLISIYDCHI